ncbi:MAG: PRC-barrel domain-containing protein [Actinobacteria bacterium]|nr:PRC-barrel domain-containing protein [Actinomycetota bacterium]
MTKTTQFLIGSEVRCSDGVCGKLSRVIVDPLARAVTHLVVDPARGSDVGRIVPLALVDETAAEVELRCTAAELQNLEPAEETHFLQDGEGYPGYDRGHVLVWPYYGFGMGGMGTGDMDLGAISGPQAVTTDTVPVGEVGIRRGAQVHASDGEIGHVQGLVIDTESHRLTHVLLQKGHLWGRKDVAIPIGAVTNVTDGIRLNLNKQQVEDLPAVNIDHPNRETGESATGA